VLLSHHSVNMCMITGRHGVPRDVIDAHFKASEEFFALPPEKKMLKVPK
jgi:isopenicillin N synthase-like dioxygenase